MTKDRRRNRPHQPISFHPSQPLWVPWKVFPGKAFRSITTHQCMGRGPLANPQRTNVQLPNDLVRAGARTESCHSCAIWAHQCDVLERTPLVGADGSLPWLVISASKRPALQLIRSFPRGNIYVLVEVRDAGTVKPEFATGVINIEA